MIFMLTPATLVLLAVVVVAAALHAISSSRRKRRSLSNSPLGANQSADAETAALPTAPGPSTVPILGSLHHMRNYNENPFEGFTVMSEEFGPVYSLKMGSTPAVVVSSFEGIKEVLIKKGSAFDGRPDILRFNLYFGGDRNQSLALCDYNNTQKTRRQLARAFLMARPESSNFEILDQMIAVETEKMMSILQNKTSSPVDIKTIVATSGMNMFTNYMCSTNFEYEDKEFKQIVSCFNAIFDDVNEGHPTDFLPWLTPFYGSYLNNLRHQASSIRDWILKSIIQDRLDTIETKEDIKDLADALMYNFKFQEEGVESLDLENVLFELEDLLGGSASLGNMTLRALYYITQNPDVMKSLQKEIDEVIGDSRLPNVLDRNDMPYMEAFMLEVLRSTSSPIVPHCATEDSSIGGFDVKKGTVVFINNYKINLSADYWDQPEEFRPTRFLDNGKVKKPAYFLPFSTGRRACIGTRIFSNITFVVVSALMQQFDVSLPTDQSFKLKQGSIAIKPQDVIFTKRQ
ncbi:unnamed protein product, partial [Meganyctiphanes norvegica]